LIEFPSQTNEITTRKSLPEFVQAESDSSRTRTLNLINQVNNINYYTIIYLIKSSCSIHTDIIGPQNLKIREHVINVHKIDEFKYICKICKKEYNSINNIKSHFPLTNN
jgi:hypothetical protein